MICRLNVLITAEYLVQKNRTIYSVQELGFGMNRTLSRASIIDAQKLLNKTACGYCKPINRADPELKWSDDEDILREHFTHMSKKKGLIFHRNCIALLQVHEYLSDLDV